MTGTTVLVAIMIGLVLLVVRWMTRPIGGRPKSDEPKTGDAKAGVPWREEKKL